MFSPELEQIASKLSGRQVMKPDERRMVLSGDRGGGNAEGNVGSTGGDTGGDPQDKAIQAIEAAQQSVAQASKNLLKKEIQIQVKQQLLQNPAIKKLLEKEGEVDQKIAGFDPGVKGSELARPTQVGALKGTELQNLIGRSGDIGRAFALRGGGISQIINDETQARQQAVDTAVTQQNSASGLLSDLISRQSAKQKAELFPLQKQKAQLQIQTERLNQAKIQKDINRVESGDIFSPSERLAYAKALGVPPNQVEEAIRQGINPADVEIKQTESEARQKVSPRLKAIQDAIPRMRELVKKVNTEDSYMGQIIKYGPFAGILGKDKDIAALGTFKALRASLARLTGEVGNLSEGEQKTIEDAFVPVWNDSKHKANAKMFAIDNFTRVLASSDNPNAILQNVLSNPEGAVNDYSGQQGEKDDIDTFLDSF